MAAEIERFISLLNLLDNASQDIGKTYIQKAVYILQEGLGEELNYEYKLHLYGPYSLQLANDIDILEELEFLDIKYEPEGYGFKINITGEGKTFLKEHKERFGMDEEKYSKVISLMIGEQTRTVELLGTVLYFKKIADDLGEIIELVGTVKPYFAKKEIKDAVKKLATFDIN